MATGWQPALTILCMCRQNPASDRPVTPLHQGRSHTEWNHVLDKPTKNSTVPSLL